MITLEKTLPKSVRITYQNTGNVLFSEKRCPNQELNTLLYIVGNYVSQLISKMSQCPEFLLTDSKVFIDDAVYTKNRNFRTFLSSKFGKHAILRKSQKDSNIGDRECFLKVNFSL